MQWEPVDDSMEIRERLLCSLYLLNSPCYITIKPQLSPNIFAKYPVSVHDFWYISFKSKQQLLSLCVKVNSVIRYMQKLRNAR